MGVAAYYRGNRAITAQIERDHPRRPAEFELMDRLNAAPKQAGAPRPFGPIRFVQSHGGWFAECPVTGFGYWYPTLFDAVRSWQVVVTGYDNGVWLAEPI